MRERAHSKTTRIQKKNKINVKARAIKQSTNSRKHDQCAGANSTEQRIQPNKVNAPARAFNKTANPSKECQCAGARIQNKRELKQTRSMRGRAHANKPRIQAHAHSQQPRTQSNKINARARVFKETANASKQGQCAGARIRKQREFTETLSMRRRAHSNNPRTHANTINALARI